MFQNEAAYIDYFKMQYTDQKIFCDITPSYSMLDKNGFEAIDRSHVKSKYVYLIRNPADRVWSTLQFNSKVLEGRGSFIMRGFCSTTGVWC